MLVEFSTSRYSQEWGATQTLINCVLRNRAELRRARDVVVREYLKCEENEALANDADVDGCSVLSLMVYRNHPKLKEYVRSKLRGGTMSDCEIEQLTRKAAMAHMWSYDRFDETLVNVSKQFDATKVQIGDNIDSRYAVTAAATVVTKQEKGEGVPDDPMIIVTRGCAYLWERIASMADVSHALLTSMRNAASPLSPAAVQHEMNQLLRKYSNLCEDDVPESMFQDITRFIIGCSRHSYRNPLLQSLNDCGISSKCVNSDDNRNDYLRVNAQSFGGREFDSTEMRIRAILHRGVAKASKSTAAGVSAMMNEQLIPTLQTVERMPEVVTASFIAIFLTHPGSFGNYVMQSCGYTTLPLMESLHFRKRKNALDSGEKQQQKKRKRQSRQRQLQSQRQRQRQRQLSPSQEKDVVDFDLVDLEAEEDAFYTKSMCDCLQCVYSEFFPIKIG